ncbi:hypothetical protein EXIGLDRAFT_727612 [Exidia glandulosa HHB12029]|uniref:Uncharacterized protein n=1 Tax=Exidia glandulosa HHB12029 TaxID=1314781 RepID=A0A165LYZ2_EXIGL|nr:hypothetical protein EXIGLDRAFT_727612 [Exidia glandulosa HHB12029]
MVTGHVAGHIPPLLTRMYDLWKKVFGCQVEDARKVLGDQFVNDPGNVFFNPYDNDDADTEADVLDPRSQ